MNEVLARQGSALANASFRITVHTSDKAGAGTHNPAFLKAEGAYGTLGANPYSISNTIHMIHMHKSKFKICE